MQTNESPNPFSNRPRWGHYFAIQTGRAYLAGRRFRNALARRYRQTIDSATRPYSEHQSLTLAHQSSDSWADQPVPPTAWRLWLHALWLRGLGWWSRVTSWGMAAVTGIIAAVLALLILLTAGPKLTAPPQLAAETLNNRPSAAAPAVTAPESTDDPLIQQLEAALPQSEPVPDPIPAADPLPVRWETEDLAVNEEPVPDTFDFPPLELDPVPPTPEPEPLPELVDTPSPFEFPAEPEMAVTIETPVETPVAPPLPPELELAVAIQLPDPEPLFLATSQRLEPETVFDQEPEGWMIALRHDRTKASPGSYEGIRWLADDTITAHETPGSHPSTQDAEVVIRKQIPASISGFEPAQCVIEVSNPTDAVQRNIQLTESLDGEVTVTSAMPHAWHGESQLKWWIDELAPGETRQFRYELYSAAPQRLVATTRIDAVQQIQSTTQVHAIRLALDMKIPTKTQAGEIVPIRFEVRNNSPVPADPVVLRLQLPPELPHPYGQDLELDISGLEPGEVRTAILHVRAAHQNDSALCRAQLVLDGDSTESLTAPIRIESPVPEQPARPAAKPTSRLAPCLCR